MGRPAGNNPPSPELVTWSPACRVTVWETISKVGMALLSPVMMAWTLATFPEESAMVTGMRLLRSVSRITQLVRLPVR